MINSYGLNTLAINLGDHLYLEGVTPVTITDIRHGWIHYQRNDGTRDACVPDALSATLHSPLQDPARRATADATGPAASAPEPFPECL